MDKTNVSTIASDREREQAKHLAIVERAIDLIDTCAHFLTIRQIGKINENLSDLQCMLTDTAFSRIPSNQLSFVENSWHLIVTSDKEDGADVAEKCRAVLRASTLKSVAGYAEQLLNEAKGETEKSKRLAETSDKEFADFYGKELAAAQSHEGNLLTALKQIQSAINQHGENIIAQGCDLSPLTFDVLINQ